MTADPPLLELSGLSVAYATGLGRHHHLAVNDVSFTIAPGETVGLVGESGAGKSSIGRAVLGLARPSAGTIRFQGEDITRAARRRRRQLGRHIQAVFQDPYSSFNPTRTVGQALLEPLQQGPPRSAADKRARVAEILSAVGLSGDVLSRRPGSFSGGQRQRIAIARALVAGPQLVICDEPVSALDLSIQAQVLNLLLDLQEKTSVSYLFISHDMAVVRFLCHRVVVLNGGMIMEAGPADQVCARPAHPYTQSLLASVPQPDPWRQRAQRLEGRAAARRGGPAGPVAAGCPFSARCPHVIEVCRQQRPQAVTAGDVTVACHRYPEVAARGPDGASAGQAVAGQASAESDEPGGLTPAGEPANGELR